MSSEMSVTEANTKFAFKLLEKFIIEESGNIFYSPFSISAALAMVRLGAAGNTRAEMTKVLLQFQEPEPSQPEGFDQQEMQTTEQIQSATPQNIEANVVDQSFKELLEELNQPNDSYALSSANRLYGETTFTFLQSFLNNTEKYYKAVLEKVDFITGAEAARDTINKWVEEQTNDKIKDLLPPGSVDNLTKLVLVNAIYFKGKWHTQFKEEETRDAPFRLNNGGTKDVKMMQLTHIFNHGATDGVQILEMPYQGNDLSMIIILPDNIEQVVKQLTDGKLNEWTEMMSRKEVQVSLPKFKMETRFELIQVLTSLGIVDLFNDSRSDLSGMSGDEGLAVTGVIHKAFVEVNEEGTEAAAATGVVIGTTSVEAEAPVNFNADHPFLIVIKRKKSKSILFAGRYSSPE